MVHLRFEPPLLLHLLVPLAAGMLLVSLLLRMHFGRVAPPVRRRVSLLALRAVSLLALLFILAGPTWIEETPGDVIRPDLFLLLDSSRSMEIGKERSRWSDAVAAVDASCRQLPLAEKASLQYFRFGHRLAAVPQAQELAALQPTDSDTRLAEALRQLTARFGRRPPAGVVLFSDGQVRDPETVGELARHYQRRGIPIHVYPPPVSADQGDVAVVAAVAPPRVRKYSDVEVQVFLRSNGYTGQRTEVSLIVPASDQHSEEILASVPISLRGGVQTVPLTYRSDFKSRKFEVRVAAMPDELTDRNNALPVSVQIDRPKIRVLYVDGSDGTARSVQTAPSPTSVPRAPLQNALAQDEDIECALLIRGAGQTLTKPPTVSGGTTFRFPTTPGELSAFDCVILSDVSADRFTPAQLDLLKDWVEQRGGGLVMAGGPNSFAAGGWKSTVLADVLPVNLDEARWTEAGANSVIVQPVQMQSVHPVWQLLPERQANQKILDQIPAFPAATIGLRPKSSAEILAVQKDPEKAAGDRLEPLIVAGRDGAGRTMAIAWPAGPPEADAFMNNWGAASNKNAAKFWRNVVYWLSENSSIGRRRLVANIDKRYYKPGDAIQLRAVVYNESAQATTDYHLWAMIEPQSFESVGSELFAPIRWPEAVVRTSGEQHPRIVWGEEFELPRNTETGDYRLTLNLAERLAGGMSDQGFRIEITAYEGSPAGKVSHGTQVDSTSVEVQVLDDPFEQQNTSTNQVLLKEIAALSGGQWIESPDQLANLVGALPVEVGPSTERRTPLWSQWWLLALVGSALTAEWLIRRLHGMA
ncbi:glutamine amidotransferase [Planctomicrobium piriforme]|nr:glutamine amidotransferase [Planctomicrobium piriforme]